MERRVAKDQCDTNGMNVRSGIGNVNVQSLLGGRWRFMPSVMFDMKKPSMENITEASILKIGHS